MSNVLGFFLCDLTNQEKLHGGIKKFTDIHIVDSSHQNKQVM
jgi:hypothetical protein